MDLMKYFDIIDKKKKSEDNKELYIDYIQKNIDLFIEVWSKDSKRRETWINTLWGYGVIEKDKTVMKLINPTDKDIVRNLKDSIRFDENTYKITFIPPSGDYTFKSSPIRILRAVNFFWKKNFNIPYDYLDKDTIKRYYLSFEHKDACWKIIDELFEKVAKEKENLKKKTELIEIFIKYQWLLYNDMNKIDKIDDIYDATKRFISSKDNYIDILFYIVLYGIFIKHRSDMLDIINDMYSFIKKIQYSKIKIGIRIIYNKYFGENMLKNIMEIDKNKTFVDLIPSIKLLITYILQNKMKDIPFINSLTQEINADELKQKLVEDFKLILGDKQLLGLDIGFKNILDKLLAYNSKKLEK